MPLAIRRRQHGRGHERRGRAGVGGAERVADARGRELPLDPLERRHLLRRDAVIVAEHGDRVVRRRPDDRDPPHARRQRQQPALVLQQDDGLPGGVAGDLTMCGGVVDRDGDRRERHLFRRIEHAEAKTGDEQAFDGAGDLGFGDRTCLHLVHERLVLGAARQVRSGLDGGHGRRANCRHEMVASQDVADGAAVADDVAGEVPLVAQAGLQQVRARASRDAVHGVVDAHDRGCLAFDDGGAECGQVGIDEVPLVDARVEAVSCRLRSAVHGVVLRRRHHLQVVRVGSLHPRHERHAHAGREIRILAVGLLAASPARVAEDVDVGRPVRQPGGAAGQRRQRVRPRWRRTRLRVVVLGAGLGGDRVGHLPQQRRVPGGGQADGLREHGRPALHDAVQGLVPPVVGRHAEARDCRRGALHLQHLLLERHARDQIRRPLPGRQLGVAKGGVGRRLGHPDGRGQGRQGEGEGGGPEPVRHAMTTGMTLGVAPFSASQNWSSFTTSMLRS